MNEPSILTQGFTLTLIGMGFVFIFLTVLIASMYALRYTVAFLDKRWPSAQPSAQADGSGNGAIALAIAAARKFTGRG